MAHNKSNTVSGVDSLYRDKTQLERMIKQETKYRKAQQDELKEYREYLTHGEIESEEKQQKRILKEAHEYKIKSLMEEGKYAEAIAKKLTDSSELIQMAGTVASNITHALDSTIREYVSAQQ
jgi:hypothetical protein